MNVLIIEDNPDLITNLYEYLVPRAYELDVAYNARSGLNFARENNYDVIILDLMLPDMDGLDVCTELRDRGDMTPVLMLTARDTLTDKLAGFDKGADDYLVKPFAMQELDARLKSLIRRLKNDSNRETIQVGDLKFDPNTLKVTREDQSIVLPPIALKIFTILIKQSPRVVPRHEIEQRIWGSIPPDSDVLRTHISTLRSAIDKNFSYPLIRTVHGIGYQLAPADEN